MRNPTQTGLYMHRRWLEAGNLGFRQERHSTICVAICAFFFFFFLHMQNVQVLSSRGSFRHYDIAFGLVSEPKISLLSSRV